MFRESLLESAPAGRTRKRWPMLLALALEVTVCGVLVALPLFSTGIIAASARPRIFLPTVKPVPIAENTRHASGGGQGTTAPRRSVVDIADSGTRLRFGPPLPPGATDDPTLPLNIGAGPSGPPLSGCDLCLSKPRGPQRPFAVSEGVSEGYLLRKVEPVYPRPLVAMGIHGEVRLHAIIAKDGTIQSLTVISGHPLLAGAAQDAVRQWRYRPYLLNHEPVEVETLITVNFTSAR